MTLVIFYETKRKLIKRDKRIVIENGIGHVLPHLRIIYSDRLFHQTLNKGRLLTAQLGKDYKISFRLIRLIS